MLVLGLAMVALSVGCAVYPVWPVGPGPYGPPPHPRPVPRAPLPPPPIVVIP